MKEKFHICTYGLKAITILLFFVFGSHKSANAQSGGYEVSAIYVKTLDTSSVLLDYSPDPDGPPPTGINAVFSQFEVTEITQPFTSMGRNRLNHIYKVYFSTGTASDFINATVPFSFIEYAEQVPIMETSNTIPNDPILPPHLALMNAYQAFDISNGNISTYKATIAIIDDAVLTTHEDLEDNILPGYDVADMDNNPDPPLSGSNAANPNWFSHGTSIAGIAGAVTDNSIGIASIGWNSNILPVKCVKNSGNPRFITDGFKGIAWAVGHGAEIINLSWGGSGFAKSDYEVIKAAKEMGVVFVAAAGNGNVGSPLYPAAYGEGTTGQSWDMFDESLVIAVASIDADGDRSIWAWDAGSHYGTWIDVSVYGTGIFSTAAGSSNGSPVNNLYASGSGTSFAAPGVVGLIALMKSYQPNRPISEILNCLLSTANSDIYNPSLHPGNIPGTLGSGRVDAYRALSCLSGCDHPVATIETTSFYACSSGSVDLVANDGISYSWSTGATTKTISVNSAGTYSVTVTLTGGCTASESITIFNAPASPFAYLIENSGLPNDGNICNPYLYTVTGSYGSSYQWSPSSGGTYSGQTKIFQTTVPSYPYTTTLTLTVTDLFGCPGLTGSTDLILNFFENPVGTMQVSENSGIVDDGLICVGSPVSLSASGGDSYQWSTGSTSADIIVFPSVTTTYSVTITNSNDCFVVLEKIISVSTCAPYISCTPCSNSAQSLNIPASNNGTKYSTLGLPAILANKNCISISGKLIVDVDLEIKNCSNILMSAGSEIVVGENNVTGFHPTLTVKDCELFGCLQMWKGITVKRFAHLIVNRSAILNAEYAIEALSSPISVLSPPTRIEIVNNSFINNYVGLYFPKGIGFGSVSHYPIESNAFAKSATGLLLPPTNINLKNYDPVAGYAGILSEGTVGQSLAVGTPGTGVSNSFGGLMNGILSKNQFTMVQRGYFSDLRGYVGTQGIASLSGSPKGIGVLSDGGWSTVNGATFIKCGHGVYSNSSSLFVNRNMMDQVQVGIQANSPALFTINSLLDQQQIIKFKEYGFLARNILYQNKLDVLTYKVENNKFESTTNLVGQTKAGIRIENAQDPEIMEKKARINKNEIVLLSNTNGIELNNHSHWDIYDNIVTPYQYLSDGIIINNCFDTYLLNNNITPSSRYDQTAISINNSNETEFCCNTTKNTLIGTNFFGPCETTVFRTTKAGNNNFAIKCSDATMLGDQPSLLLDPTGNYGNLFEGGFGSVLHEGSDVLIGDSEFFVKTENLPDHPNWVYTPNATLADWFNVTGSDLDLCNEDCNDPQLAPHRDPRIYDTDLHFATGAYLNTIYGDMITWEGQMSLYKKLITTPALINGSSILQSFYQNAQNGIIGAYYSVDYLIQGISELPSGLAYNIQNSYLAMVAGQNTIENQQLDIFQAQSQADSLLVYYNVNSTLTNLSSSFTILNGYLHEADSLRYLKNNIALALNESLPANNVLQDNIKTINRIYLQTVARGVFSLTNDQFSQVSAIANQCPLTGGKVVYKARSLYDLRENGYFDDNEICNGNSNNQNRNSFKSTLEDNRLMIVPNPSTDMVEIYFPEDKEKNEVIKIRILTSNGQLVTENLVNSAEGFLKIEVSKFPSGLYICTLSRNGLPTQSKKFVVQH